VIFSVGHRLAHCLLGCVMVSARRQVSKDAELAAGVVTPAWGLITVRDRLNSQSRGNAVDYWLLAGLAIDLWC
jgi:hypothetical protein